MTACMTGASDRVSCIQCTPCSALADVSMPLADDVSRFEDGDCGRPEEPLRLGANLSGAWPGAMAADRDPLAPAADAMACHCISLDTSGRV